MGAETELKCAAASGKIANSSLDISVEMLLESAPPNIISASPATSPAPRRFSVRGEKRGTGLKALSVQGFRSGVWRSASVESLLRSCG